MKQKVLSFFNRKYLRVWIMLISVVLALIGFEEIYDDVFLDPLEGDYEARAFDAAVSKQILQLRSPVLNQVMTDLTSLGSVSVISTFFIILFIVLFSRRDFKGITFISIVLSGAGLWPYFLKLNFMRIRPDQSDWLINALDSSFPSGHSFGSVATYIGLAYYASQYAKTWTLEFGFFFLGCLLALLVGISRIYLGVHYPTDVAAGLLGGIAWGFTAATVYELFFRKTSTPDQADNV